MVLNPGAGEDDEDQARRLIAAQGITEGWLQLDLEDEPPGSIIYFTSGGDTCRRAKVRVEKYTHIPCASMNTSGVVGNGDTQGLSREATFAAVFAKGVFGDSANYASLVVETVAGSTPPHPEESEEDCEHEDKGYDTGTTEVPGKEARFSYPWGCAYSHKHKWLLVADNGCAVSTFANDRLKRVASDGTTAVIAGGYQGYRDGRGARARFRHIAGVTVDDSSDVAYVADMGNHCIRRVNLVTGDVTTLVGQGQDTAYETIGGFKDGALGEAEFRHPQGIAFDAATNVIFVGDCDNHRIRVIDLNTKRVSTLAGQTIFGSNDGSSATARFKHPTQLALDPVNRTLYISDHYNHLIRYIQLNPPPGTTHEVKTLSGQHQGHCDGAAEHVTFNYPEGLALDTTHKILYVADFRNGKLRAVAALGHKNQGAAATIAGLAGAGLVDGPAHQSKIYKATGVALDLPSGHLYFTDQFNHRIRRLFVPRVAHE